MWGVYRSKEFKDYADMREKSDEKKMALESEDGGELNFSYKIT